MSHVVELKPALENPFVIASCHLTGSSNAIRSLRKLLLRWHDAGDFDSLPGAIILKTVSSRGGDGRTGKRLMWKDREYEFVRYTDGPKTMELLEPT